jgi:hypothetical protein
MHGLRFSDEVVGDRAEHVGPRPANVCLPTSQKNSAAHNRKCCDRGLGSAEKLGRLSWRPLKSLAADRRRRLNACNTHTEFGIDQNNTRTQSRYAAFWERHMGDPQRRLTLTKQSCLGIARQPMKVSNQFNAHAQHGDALDRSRIGHVFIGFRRAAADFAAARWREAPRRSNTSDLRFSFSAADRSHRSD